MAGGHNPLDGYIGVKLGVELRAHALQTAEALGLSLSEWTRLVIGTAIQNGPHGFNGPAMNNDHGFLMGRELGFRLAQARIREVLMDLPISYDEAVARYGVGLNQ